MPLTRHQANSNKSQFSNQDQDQDAGQGGNDSASSSHSNVSNPNSARQELVQNRNNNGINVFLPPHRQRSSNQFANQDLNQLPNDGARTSDAHDMRHHESIDPTDEFIQNDGNHGLFENMNQGGGEEEEEDRQTEQRMSNEGIMRNLSLDMLNASHHQHVTLNDRNRNHNQQRFDFDPLNGISIYDQNQQTGSGSARGDDFNHHDHEQRHPSHLSSRLPSPLSKVQDPNSSSNSNDPTCSVSSSQEVQEEFLALQRGSSGNGHGRRDSDQEQRQREEQQQQDARVQTIITTPRPELMRVESPSPGMGMAKPVRLQQNSPTSPTLPPRSQSRQSMMMESHFNDNETNSSPGLNLNPINSSSQNGSSSIPLSGSLSQPLPILRSMNSMSQSQSQPSSSQPSSQSSRFSPQESSSSPHSISQPQLQLRTQSRQAIMRIPSSSSSTSSNSSISLNPSSSNSSSQSNGQNGRTNNHAHSLSLGQVGESFRDDANRYSIHVSTSSNNRQDRYSSTQNQQNNVFHFPTRPSVLSRGLSSPMTSSSANSNSVPVPAPASASSPHQLTLGESLNLTVNHNGSSHPSGLDEGNELLLSPENRFDGDSNQFSEIYKTPLSGNTSVGNDGIIRKTPASSNRNRNIPAFSSSNSAGGVGAGGVGSSVSGDRNGLGLFSPFTTPQRSVENHHKNGYQSEGNHAAMEDHRVASNGSGRGNHHDVRSRSSTLGDHSNEFGNFVVPSNGHAYGHGDGDGDEIDSQGNRNQIHRRNQDRNPDETEDQEAEEVDELSIAILPSSIPDPTDYSNSTSIILSKKNTKERTELLELIQYIDEYRCKKLSNSAPPSSSSSSSAPNVGHGNGSGNGSEKKRYLTELERKRICQHLRIYNDAPQTVVASLFGMDRSNISKISAGSQKWLRVLEKPAKGTHPVPPHDAILETYRRSHAWCLKMKEAGTPITDSELKERIPFFAHKVGFSAENAPSWNDWLSKYIHNVTIEECLKNSWKDYPGVRAVKKKEPTRKDKGKSQKGNSSKNKEKERARSKGSNSTDFGIGSSNLDQVHLAPSFSSAVQNQNSRIGHFPSPSISSSYQETQDGLLSPDNESSFSNNGTSVSTHSRKSSSSSRLSGTNLTLSSHSNQDVFGQDSANSMANGSGLGIFVSGNRPHLQHQSLQRSIHERNQNNQDSQGSLMSRTSSFQSNSTNSSSTSNSNSSSLGFSNPSHSRITSQPQSRSNSIGVNLNDVLEKSLSNQGSDGFADDSGLSFPTDSTSYNFDSRSRDLVMNQSSPQTTPKSSHKRHFDLMTQDHLPLEARESPDVNALMENGEEDPSVKNTVRRTPRSSRMMASHNSQNLASISSPSNRSQPRMDSSSVRNQDGSFMSRNSSDDISIAGSLKRRRNDNQSSQRGPLDEDFDIEEREERNSQSHRSPFRRRIAEINDERARWLSSTLPSSSTFNSSDEGGDKRRRMQSSNSFLPLNSRFGSRETPLRPPFGQQSADEIRSNSADWPNERCRSLERLRGSDEEIIDFVSGNKLAATPSTMSASSTRNMAFSDPRGSQHYHQQARLNKDRLRTQGNHPARNRQLQPQQSVSQSQRSPSPFADSSTSSTFQQGPIFDERATSESPRESRLRNRTRSSTTLTNRSSNSSRRDNGRGLTESEHDSNSISSSTPRLNDSASLIGNELGQDDENEDEGDMVTVDQAKRSLDVVLRFLNDQPETFCPRSGFFALGSLQAILHGAAERASAEDDQPR